MSILNTTSVACVSLCNDPLGARDTKEKDDDIMSRVLDISSFLKIFANNTLNLNPQKIKENTKTQSTNYYYHMRV